MLENKMSYQEGYAAGYAAAQEKIDKLEEELKAAVADITPFCSNCKNKYIDLFNVPCKDCIKGGSMYSGEMLWEWRGVK